MWKLVYDRPLSAYLIIAIDYCGRRLASELKKVSNINNLSHQPGAASSSAHARSCNSLLRWYLEDSLAQNSACLAADALSTSRDSREECCYHAVKRSFGNGLRGGRRCLSLVPASPTADLQCWSFPRSAASILIKGCQCDWEPRLKDASTLI